MRKGRIKKCLLAACFALLALSGASCSWWSLATEKFAPDNELSSSAPKLADVIKITPSAKAIPDTPAPATIEPEPSDKSISLEQWTFLRSWWMLVGVLLLLFLLSLMLFHHLGRRLGKRSFRAHAPTPHADIWASHKPPQFFDP